jgi:UDP-N-acetylmuramate dehydrogenase
LKIQENISLKDKNWFGTGGNARYYVQPTNNEEFRESIEFSNQHKLEIFVLGSGANILVSDDGFDGLVISPSILDLEVIDDKFIRAGAGVLIDDLINFSLSNNLSGLEEFSAIPGTVGGSVYINIHYYNYLLSDFLVSARVINSKTGEIVEVDKDWLEMGYDTSKLHYREYFLLDATFQLKKVDELETAYIRGRIFEIDRHRKSKYPYKGTCGSFFRNFHEDEVNLEIGGKKAIWSAYYLDKIGVKGELSVGGARVSHQHANMLVNTDSATSSDIINLARKMQELVKDRFGIVLQPECQLVGFKDYPLYK